MRTLTLDFTYNILVLLFNQVVQQTVTFYDRKTTRSKRVTQPGFKNQRRLLAQERPRRLLACSAYKQNERYPDPQQNNQQGDREDENAAPLGALRRQRPGKAAAKFYLSKFKLRHFVTLSYFVKARGISMNR